MKLIKLLIRLVSLKTQLTYQKRIRQAKAERLQQLQQERAEMEAERIILSEDIFSL